MTRARRPIAESMPTDTASQTMGKKIGSYRLRHEIIAAKRALYGIRNAEAIAEQANISVQAVRKVLSGKQQNPQLRTLVAICQALDLSLDEIVEY